MNARTLAPFALLLLASGCGPSASGGSGDGSGSVGTGTTTSGPVNEADSDTEFPDYTTGSQLPDPDPDPEPIETCQGNSIDHRDDCGSDCPLITDVRVTCDANAFGDPGLRVSPEATGGTWLVTASNETAWAMSIHQGGLGHTRELPEIFSRTTLSLVLDGHNGTPFVAADTTTAPDFEGGVTFLNLWEDDEESELVYDGDVYSPVVEMDVDGQGRPHLWARTNPPSGRTLFIREDDGSWTQQAALVPGTSGWQSFALTPAGVPVGFDFVEQATQWELTALEDGETQPVGTDGWPSFPGAHVQIAALPQPHTDALEPGYVVLKQHDDGYHLAWKGAAEELVLAETAPLQRTCELATDGSPGQCPTACEEQGTGLETPMIASARTSDGRVWVAWMLTHLDQSLFISEECAPEVGCTCNPTVGRDESRGELVLSEVDLDTREVREVFRLQDTNPHLWGLFFGTDLSIARAFDMRAFDKRLAIGARVREDGAFDPAAMWVLGVDTELIP